jgi:hypothetical protein
MPAKANAASAQAQSTPCAESNVFGREPAILRPVGLNAFFGRPPPDETGRFLVRGRLREERLTSRCPFGIPTSTAEREVPVG